MFKFHQLPTTIIGCMFDDGWEFDMPTIIYFPFLISGYGSNDGKLYDMTECLCRAIVDENHNQIAGWESHLKEECAWRGWSIGGFSRRKNATHIQFNIIWAQDYHNGLHFSIVDSVKKQGPFKKIMVGLEKSCQKL